MSEQAVTTAEQAETIIRSSWLAVAEDFHVNWVGPVELVLQNYPQVAEGVADIKDRISEGYYIILFEPPKDASEHYVMAIPFADDQGNCNNARLITARELPGKKSAALGLFAEAMWKLIEEEKLPSPESGLELVQQLTNMTGPELTMA